MDSFLTTLSFPLFKCQELGTLVLFVRVSPEARHALSAVDCFTKVSVSLPFSILLSRSGESGFLVSRAEALQWTGVFSPSACCPLLRLPRRGHNFDLGHVLVGACTVSIFIEQK